MPSEVHCKMPCNWCSNNRCCKPTLKMWLVLGQDVCPYFERKKDGKSKKDKKGR